MGLRVVTVNTKQDITSSLVPVSVTTNIVAKTSRLATVWIVDDEPMVTASIKALLSLENLYLLCVFHTPQQALDTLKSTSDKPSVIISDFYMPGMDGVTFLQQARPLVPEASLILLTGYADKNSAIKAINTVGLYRYLEKPWDNAALRMAIANGVERCNLLSDLRGTQAELDSIKAIQRLREDFVATLTHDLRTPLLAAITTLGFLNNGTLGPLTERQQSMLGMLVDSHQQTLNLVNSLLDVYRYESGQQRLIFETLALDDLLAVVIDTLAPLARGQGKTLTMAPISADIPLTVKADRQELRRVLINLVGNAIQHSGEGKAIWLTLGVVNVSPHTMPMLRIGIHDEGPGIPEEDLPWLFQRFSQGTSHKRSSGTGLGLYLSRQIIERHQGVLGVNNHPNRTGCCFWVQLPHTNIDI
jgi:two-component system, sensor histidine kinase and response regulator